MSQADLTATPPRILIVDDSRMVRATVKKHLAAGFEVIEENDGEAGWERLVSDELVQVLISDLSMPRLDGFGLLARIRQSGDARIKNTPVIIISGEEDPKTKQEAVDKGANDFITKSTDRAEMIARVSAAVQLAKTARDLRYTEAVQAKTSTVDVKTGLATQHLLEIEGEKALSLALRHQTEVTLLVFKFDEFGPLLARVGEEVADKLMGMMAKLLAAKLRKEETLARLDGSSFGLILPSPLPGSITLAERLRATIAAAKINFRGEQINLTASCGVACTSTEATYELHPLLDAATRRASVAHARGGNCIEAPPLSPLSPIAVDAALELLSLGKIDAVRPHLANLMKRLEPLLKLVNQELPKR